MEIRNLFFVYTQIVLVQADIYSKLGLENTASNGEIKQAYYKLALRYHPDRNSENDTTNKFIEITNAYTALMGNQEAFDGLCQECTDVDGEEEAVMEEMYEDLLRHSKGFNVYMDDVQNMNAEDMFNL